MGDMTERQTAGSARGTSYRDRKRRMVQQELITTATHLFLEQGYQATTVDQIAGAVGMSERTFFRYFPSKDALVLGKYEQLGEAFAARLCARPRDEAVWIALRRMLDQVVEYSEAGTSPAGMQQLDGIVASTDSLRAGYLERLERMQEEIAGVLRERDPQLSAVGARAVVAAVFSCMASATAEAARTGAPLGDALDQAMTAVEQASAEGVARGR